MDGQHRRQVGLRLQLSIVPCILIDYKSVRIRSLREEIEVSLDQIYANRSNNKIYPYKTAKHYFEDSIFENFKTVNTIHLQSLAVILRHFFLKNMLLFSTLLRVDESQIVEYGKA